MSELDELELDEDEATKFELELATINHHRKNAADNAIDAFVAELEKVVDMQLGNSSSEWKFKILTELKYDIKQTAQRMKGEG